MGDITLLPVLLLGALPDEDQKRAPQAFSKEWRKEGRGRKERRKVAILTYAQSIVCFAFF